MPTLAQLSVRLRETIIGGARPICIHCDRCAKADGNRLDEQRDAAKHSIPPRWVDILHCAADVNVTISQPAPVVNAFGNNIVHAV